MSKNEFLDWYQECLAKFQAEGLGPDQHGKAMEIILVCADQFDDMLDKADLGDAMAQRCAKAITAWSKQVEISGFNAGCACCETMVQPRHIGMFAMFNPLDPAHKQAVCCAICEDCADNKTPDEITRELMDMLGEHFNAEVQRVQ